MADKNLGQLPVGTTLSGANLMLFDDGTTTQAMTVTNMRQQILNNLSGITSAATARTNLGLGTAATSASTAFDAAGVATSAVSAHTAATDPHGDRAYALGLVGGSGKGGNTYVVASYTADAAIQARADYVCDGTADEVQINTALALGNVLLTDGDYIISTPILMNRPGHALIGSGYGLDMTGAGAGLTRGEGTLIMPATPTFTGDYIIDVQQTGATRPAGQVTIRNLKIDGVSRNNVATTGITAIHLRTFQCSVSSLEIRRMSGHGINLHGYSTAEISPNGWSTYDSRFMDIHIDTVDGSCFYLQNGTDWVMVNCVFQDAGESGLRYDNGASGQIVNCHFYANDVAGIHFDGAGSRLKILGSKFEHNHQHGIWFDGSTTGVSGVQIIGCGFNCNGQDTNNTWSHIGMTGSGQNNKFVIANNVFGNSDGIANLAKYCIDLSTTGVGGTIIGNEFGTDGSLANAGVASGMVNWSGSTVRRALKMSGNHGIRDMLGGTEPTANAASGAGGSPPAPVVPTAATDHRGTITFGTGSAPSGSAGAALVTVVYALPWEFTSHSVIIVPANQATEALGLYVATADISTTQFVVRWARTAPAASQANTVYAFTYMTTA